MVKDSQILLRPPRASQGSYLANLVVQGMNLDMQCYRGKGLPGLLEVFLGGPPALQKGSGVHVMLGIESGLDTCLAMHMPSAIISEPI